MGLSTTVVFSAAGLESSNASGSPAIEVFITKILLMPNNKCYFVHLISL
ncbi:hypothetical protein [Methanobrevibacter sp.]